MESLIVTMPAQRSITVLRKKTVMTLVKVKGKKATSRTQFYSSLHWLL